MNIVDRSSVARPDYPLDPKELGFGRLFAAHMLSCTFRNGAWENAEIHPVRDITLHPAAIVFHYAQAIFEGIKAYRAPDGSLHFFRVDLNIRRFNRSAARLEMPQLPEEFLFEALSRIVRVNEHYVPQRPGSLYLRPTMIGTEGCLGVRSSTEYLFYVLAVPTGSYFKTDVSGPGAVDVLVSTEVARAAQGGTGNVKAAANYAISLKPNSEAKEVGCSQVLFLDAKHNRFVEELGGMNVFFYDGKKLITPELTDTILPGVTRQSILEVAPDIGIPAEERKIDFEEIAAGIKSGKITEAFATGTGAVCTGIRSLVVSRNGEKLLFPGAPGPVTSRIYQKLTDIQFGAETEDRGWIQSIA